MGEELFYGEFTRNVRDLLRAGRPEEALALFRDPSNFQNLQKNSWDLIPVVAQFLSSEKLEVFLSSKEMIETLAEVSNPEEAILQFVEELEEVEEDTKFTALLKPLRTIMVRVPERRIHSLAWCFNSIHTFLNKSEVPINANLVGKEKLLLDTNESVQIVTKRYEALMDLCQQLLAQISNKSDQHRLVLRKFFITLLGRPMVYVDMERFGRFKSKARIISEKIIFYILQLTADPLSLLDIPIDDNAELFKLGDEGLADIFYLIYSEGVGIETVPKVYSPYYFFQNSLRLSVTLLNVDHQIVIEKGLYLANTLLSHVYGHKLSYLMLDSDDHSKFCKALSNVIVYNRSENMRKFALDVYRRYLLSFEPRGFYLLIYNLISVVRHAGVVGFTIGLFKDVLADEISKSEAEISQYYTKEKLFVLLRLFCDLPKKAETDLIEMSDQIIASLNLLRYLVLRDGTNVTGIWSYVPILEEEYFGTLRVAIGMSRAHYELRIKEVTERTASGDEGDVTVMVGGENLKDLSKQEKLDVLRSSLTAFDVMESLLARLLECIELNKK